MLNTQYNSDNNDDVGPKMPDSKSDIKIFILYGDHRNYGGVVQFYLKLSKYIKASKYKIQHFRVGRLVHLRIYSITIFRMIDLAINYFRFTYRVIREKPCIIHLNPSLDKKSIYRDFGYAILTKLCARRTKILIHFRGWEDRIANKLFRKSFLKGIIVNLLKRANLIIVQATKFKKILDDLNVHSCEIVIMPTTVCMEEYERFKTLKSDQNEIYILFMARLLRVKGVYDLVDSMRSIAQSNPNKTIKFIFAGDGNEKRKLEDYVFSQGLKDLVIFPGYLRGREKINLLLNAQIFILPSYDAEGCPNCVIEAMGAGLPVIATRVGAVEEIIVDGLNGLLIESHSTEQIIDAVNRLVNDDVLRQKMGEMNKRKARERFDAPIIFRQLESIYDCMMMR